MSYHSIEVKCRCKTTTKVELEEATGYLRVTPFMCDCGRTYLIRDYVNAMTSANEVEHKEYDEFLKSEKEDKRIKKMRETEGREIYQAVEKWLNSLSTQAIANIEAQRTFHQTIDKEFVIETILLHCRTEDDLLEKLYTESLVSTIDFDADNKSPQCFTDKKDWYILKMIGCVDPSLSRPYDTELEVQTVIEACVDAPGNSQNSYSYFSVTKGAKIDF